MTVGTPADRALRYTLVLLAIPGFLPPRPWNPLPVSTLLDAAVVVVGVVAFISHRAWQGRDRTGWYAAVIAYLGFKTTWMVLGATPAPIPDYLQAYEAYLFLIPLTWYVARGCFTREGLARTTQILLVVFLAKYAISVAMSIPRPVVWMENNYELMTLIGFVYLSWAHLERRTAWLGLLCAVVLLSGSRSSILELLLVIVALYLRPGSPRFLLYCLPIGAIAWTADHVFAARMGAGGMRSVDRYSFFEVFLSETTRWSSLDWLIGTTPLTPLSITSCGRLSYYTALFSSYSTDVCYSVILHSFLMRAIYDQGLLGLAFLLGYVWLCLSRSHIDRRGRVTILGIGLLNSLSVSSFNSEFMLLLLIVAAGLAREVPVVDVREPSLEAAASS